ncbi:MAG: hypothetical protein ACI8P3_000636 [Saprospiraceae bacterium]|jgi:uncharacterized protein (DUF1015 family)
MSIFVPFKAFRPTKENVSAVASKPYDVLNEKEAKAECADNPLSFYHVIKPEIDFSGDFDHYGPEVYQKGKENFDSLVNNGIMAQDESACFYVYQLNMNGHEQTGLVGACSIDDYFNNSIKKHELTRPDKEEDRKNHIRASKLNYEPVFFAYPHVDTIDDLVSNVKRGTPIYDFIADDGIEHRLWIIDQPEMLSQISGLFETHVPNVYIADGHHRTAAGALVGQELRNDRQGVATDGKRDNYLMAVVFPDNQLKVLDYNRVVTDLNGLTAEELMTGLSENFEIEQKDSQYRPEAMHTFGMYLNNKWYKLIAKEGTYNDSDPVGQLDVTILSNNVLEPFFDIVDLRKDKRIDFIGGMRGLGELEKRVDSGEMKVAFSMYPVSMQQIINISDNDLIMPPKVTWFEPKLRSGLFVHNLDE